MKGFTTIFTYTFKENIKKKSFIISTVVVLILTVGAILLPTLINSFKGSNESKQPEGTAINSTANNTVYVIDEKAVFKDDLSILAEAFQGYTFKTEEASRLESLKEEIKNDKTKSLLLINESNGMPGFEYYVEQSDNGLPAVVLSKVFKNIHTAKLLKPSNVSQEVIGKVVSDITFSVKELGQNKFSGYLFGFSLSILLFFTIYFYGYGVAMSVASEKTSRVMEVLITSTKPSIIILGKTAAMGVLGLLQFASVLLTGFVTYKLSSPDNFSIGGVSLQLPQFTPGSIAFIIVLFILGYLLYAMMNAVAGATVSKAEDVNSALMPINMIALIAFYFAYFTIFQSSGNLAVIASIFPLSAPFSMPSRLIIDAVPAWQMLLSLCLMLLCTFLMAFISIKLYSSAVLHYGKRLKLSDLFKISKEG